jgi:hypothetical protein
MGKTKVLVTVKTHPSISAKYGELVCTAGFLEDSRFIRIYPVPFRGLSEWEQYKKYEWIELDLTKNTSDFRPESYRPTDLDNIGLKSLGVVDSKDWTLRRDLVLRNVRTNLDQLIGEARQKGIYTSLAVFKPTAITGFHIAKAEVKDLTAAQLAAVRQSTLFDTRPEVKRAKQSPFDFFYTFIDDTGKERRLKILDWEIGALFWKCLKSTGDAGEACKLVRAKYAGAFMSRDLYFYLGTIKDWQLRAPNPFSIIGVFYPPVETQQRLFVPEIPPVR